jgi:uncharacterized protein with NAD-binding domain and iron-sulfur cluster
MDDNKQAETLATALAAPSGTTDAHARAAHLAGALKDMFKLPGSPVTEAHGTLDTRVHVLVLPIDEVRKLLPSGLELAPQPVVPYGWHPVYVMSSHDKFNAWFGDMDYEELLIGVPWVQVSDPLASNPGPFIYMPRLYLNATVPRELGVHIYGWEKQAATITVTTAGPRTDYRVIATGTTTPTVNGTFQEIPGAAARPPADFANFTIVRQLFEQPTISQAFRIIDPNAFSDRSGPFLATTVLLQVDQPGTTVQPILSELVIGPSLTPAGIPAGTYRSAGLDTCELGSFRLQCKIFVSLPGSCADVQFPRPPPLRKLKVAILGGGPAACAAALYLARQRDRYEVSIYTTGYRLGGKCQSWRDPDKAYRIEEHGLHAFLGFYHNAFTSVQDAYDAAFPAPGHGQAMYARAFHAEPNNGVMVFHKDQWSYCKTPGRTTPGPVPGASIPGVTSGQAMHLAMEHAFTRVLDHIAAIAAEVPLLGRLLADLQRETTLLRCDLRSRTGEVALTGQFHPVSLLTTRTGRRGLEWVRSEAARLLQFDTSLSTYVWFLWTGIDTLLTIIIGLARNPVKSLNELDGVDFRVWLRANGLRETGDEHWSVIDQVYETLFAHQAADPTRSPCDPIDTNVHPDLLACGVAMRWFLLESFGDQGAPAYRFTYSCAQTMMTPFYLALRQLGAKVHFFHTVTGLELAGSGVDRRLTAVKLSQQAEVKAGSDAYEPLLTEDLPNNPRELHDWPKDPHWDQLVDGDWYRDNDIDFLNAWQTLRNTRAKPVELRRGVDFDLCILGVPIGALPLVDSPLTDPSRPDADPRWKRMIDGIAVTQTMSFQLWINEPSSALIANPPRGLLTSYAQPEPSYGDFTPLLTYETWSEPRPQYVAYFTGSSVSGKPILPPTCGPDYPEAMQAAWNVQVRTWLDNNYKAFYDGTSTPTYFNGFLELLAVEGRTLTPDQRLEWQHLIADVQPSNLYVLSQPGAMALRLGQAESGVKDLFLCGDWTRTDMNCGCVEAATSSGMLASRAISNEPRTIWRPGF